jgi:signal transduction histidine kinase
MGRGLDLYARHKDGTEVPVEISLGPIERDGELYVVATISDISGRKAREETLRSQNESLEEFADVVAHDFRGPLSTITGRLQLVREEHDSDHLDAIEESVERMETLVEEILTLARTETVVEDTEPVELAPVVEACWRNTDTADAELVVETDRTVRAGETRLQQLIGNLLQNAVEHGGEDVTVVVGDLDDGFYVEDDGPGIPAEERAQVFQRGYSTAEEGSGAGLGLAIVEKIAEEHGWEVRVLASEAGGARFEVRGVDAV